MNPTRTTSKPPPRPARLRQPARYALAACACAALVACGGGSGSAGVGTGGTGSFAVGSINGLGSIYVNGVRFDTVGASVSNANALAGAAPTTADLALGMTVEVRGDINPNTQRGTAASVVIASEIKAAITAVGVGALTIAGRTVQVTPATVYAGNIDGPPSTPPTPVTGLAQLAVGHVVEVYALPQPDGSLRATRIEFEEVSVAEFVREYPTERFHVEGLLTHLGGTAPERTFRVAGVEFRETATHPLPATLANNTEVTVSFAPAAGAGPFDAVAVRVESRAFATGVGLAEIEGLVSGWDANQQTFTLQGFPVRLGAGVVFEFDGVVQPVMADGVRVEVYGDVVAGVLVATKVEFEDEDQEPFEFAGVADCGGSSTCTASAGSFIVRGVTIDYDRNTSFEDFDPGFSPANLGGIPVRVEAKPAAGGGNRFIATLIASEQ